MGRLAAWAVLVVLASLGLDVVLRTSEMAFVALKWMGVGYLVFLAWRFWRADTASDVAAPDASMLMRREFFTLLGNPKAYLLLTAFLPQFVNEAETILPQLFILGGLYIVAEGFAALIWVTAGSLVGGYALTPFRRRMINRTAAGVMGSAAVLLARSERAA
ncbi:Threonine/homoserine/homoserine lactone efflux protein [Rhodospira trueperi]|uniref:Threonine/homoserine/homoserine lactone efflux protein n=2 Tax=Rhodospira trueperi TaxID=69960 RepID=A0A1G6YWE0_9PROT|nr:Threonine/homoserine/homoserine lactone efflux protein [Rhodospira trueperi]